MTYQSVIVTVRAHDRRIKPHEAEGFVPFATCPLAVMPAHEFDSHEEWKAKRNEWVITHRPTGFYLGGKLTSREVAERVLNAAQPNFPGWLMANGYEGDLATIACRAVYRAALIANGIEVPETVEPQVVCDD